MIKRLWKLYISNYSVDCRLVILVSDEWKVWLEYCFGYNIVVDFYYI